MRIASPPWPYIAQYSLQIGGSVCSLLLRLPLVWLSAALLFALFLGGKAHAMTVLEPSKGPLNLAPFERVWVDETGVATPEQVDALPDSAFVPQGKRSAAPQGPRQAIWMRLDFSAPNAGHWVLNAQQVSIDQVSLYALGGAGTWVGQHAGTSVPVSRWPIADTRPSFALDLHRAETTRVLVRAHDTYGSFVSFSVMSAKQYVEKQFTERVMLGLYLGVTLVVVLLGLANWLGSREWVWLSYAGYNLLMTTGQLTVIGLGGATVLSGSPQLNEGLIFTLVPIAAGVFGIFSVFVAQAPRLAPAWARSVLALSFLCLAWALAFWLLPNGFHDPSHAGMYESRFHLRADFMAQTSMLIALGTGVLGTVLFFVAWRRGHRTSGGALMAMGLVVPTTLPQVLYSLHLIDRSLLTEYSIILGLVSEAVFMLVVLQRHSSHKAETQNRLRGLGLNDALTGLAPRTEGIRQLNQLLEHCAMANEPCPFLLVNVSNVDELGRLHGHETADAALLITARQMVTLRKEGDVLTRVGWTRYLLVPSRPADESELRTMATTLVAGGLAESPPLLAHMSRDLHVHIGHWRADADDAARAVEQLELRASQELQPGDGRRIFWVAG